MKHLQQIVTLSLLCLAPVCLHADTLTGNGSLQSWSSSVLGTVAVPTTGGPFWNNISGDGTAYNIGWCLTGTGNCHISNTPGTLSYYGNGTAAASNISFSGAGTAQVATFVGAFTNQNGVPPSGSDIFGWYSVSSGVISTHQLFASGVATGATATFTPSANYGFFLENVQSAGQSYEADYFYFMNYSLNYAAGTGVADPGTQHFSAFSAANNSYYLGIEDTPAPTADFDYNDFVVQLQPAPEPASIALLASGISFLAWSIRRHHRR